MYLPALTSFYSASTVDNRLGSDHVAIYMALFQSWNLNGFKNPVAVSKTQILQWLKISKAAYNRCMRELHDFGYIKYIPSFHPILGSLVYMDMFSRKAELSIGKAKSIPDTKTL